ncbi:MAG: apolipoprotein N-acyltransferase [Bacteroidia bacterium]
MKSYQLFLLSLLSALLLAFGWFPHGFVPLLFIAFVPLLMVENAVFRNPGKYHPLTLIACTYLSFFLWNVLTTWWIKNASLGGAAMAIICNALLMTFTFILFHNTRKRLDEKWRSLVFISFWLTFEFLHHDWDLTWTWLTLGNAFADVPGWIQWYEYTGVFGGSLWVLIINCFVFTGISKLEAFNKQAVLKLVKSKAPALLALLVVPVGLSYLILATSSGLTNSVNAVIVQPNIDPYNEKFVSDYEEQLQKMLKLAAEKADSTTDYVIFPETALTENLWENQLKQSSSIHILKEFLKAYPKMKIIVGASTAKVYEPGEQLSATARKFTQQDGFYDSYNTAIQLDSSNNIQLYHKSRLVPGVEKMPFPFIFKYLDKLAIDMGGTTGSLGTQDERTVFTSGNDSVKAAPVICYESVYGEFVSDYIRAGASFIAIITNDGWWGDTPGYKQHLKYGTLRAIETRRYIARSANTGISCVITDKGEIQQASSWWTPDAIKAKIYLNNTLTFYTKYGDFIARFTMYLSFALIAYSLFLRFKR